jgi:ubiquinone/menaquinone biosynthesis C-methylase UbiE
MNHNQLPPADRNGIVRALPEELSEVNKKRIGKFGAFMVMYDLVQNYWVRPRIHKADRMKHRAILHEVIAPVKEADVLDIACGTGGAIYHFHRSNRYTGLDLSYAMLRRAIRKAKVNGFFAYTIVEGNAEELLFGNDRFHLALIDTALHMIPQYRQCLDEAARVLKRGGDLICSCPAVGINQEFDILWAKIAPKRCLHSFEESDLIDACTASGLRYDRIGTNGGVLYFRACKK